jgi:hypothetical protein
MTRARKKARANITTVPIPPAIAVAAAGEPIPGIE